MDATRTRNATIKVSQRIMTSAVPDILARIVAHKQEQLAKYDVSLEAYEQQAETRVARDFAGALAAHPPAIIAEVKQASPSKGVFPGVFDPEAIARSYAAGGAAALSVLTDEQFFRGSLDHLRIARAAVDVPVIRKDFTIHRIQIAEAAAAGADAILLIVAILNDAELRDFREYAESLRLTALVEVHDAAELSRAVDSGARVIGVNNRDLRTFEVHLETSLRLAEAMPEGAVRVSESGITSGADVARLRAAGFHAFLVGEHLMRSGNPAGAIEDLRAC